MPIRHVRNEALSFDDEVIASILNKPSALGEETPGTSSNTYEDWESLSLMKKNRVKSALHGILMTEYLRSKIAPMGLIVLNEPRIFLEDAEFRKSWAQIAWKCTRDWLVLIINTAQRLVDELTIKIQAAETHIKTTVTLATYKTKLAEINAEMKENETYLTQQKINKLHKDIKKFNFEKVFPYSMADFIPTSKSTAYQKKKSNNQYWTSSSDDQWSSSEEDSLPSTSRGPPPPLFSHQPLNIPYNPQFWNFHPFFQPRYPFQQPQPPFLGRGRGRGRGRRRGRMPQVQWQDEVPQMQTRSRGQTTNKQT